jgi:hypothetical protein
MVKEPSAWMKWMKRVAGGLAARPHVQTSVPKAQVAAPTAAKRTNALLSSRSNHPDPHPSEVPLHRSAENTPRDAPSGSPTGED